MKLKVTFVASLLLPIASQAFMATATMNMKAHDCAQRSNAVGAQMNNLKGILHKVALVDGESGREVSSDPTTEEAQNAEASGTARFCGKSVGTLNLMELDGETVLVGTAHGFYKNGDLLCDDSYGTIHPDLQYAADNTYGIDRTKGYAFEMPPMNHSEALKYDLDLTNSGNLKDLIVLRILDQDLFNRQTGGKRKRIQPVEVNHDELKSIAEASKVFITSKRTNFKEYRKVSFESNCKINDYVVNEEKTKLKKHSCDTGGNSSGSSLNFLDANNNIHSLGIHYGGVNSSMREFGNEKSSRGNFLVPSEVVIQTIRDALKESPQI